MRAVMLSPPPTDPDGKLDWLISAVQQIARASQTDDPNKYADGFVLTNVTTSRTMDADTVTLAQLADIVGTFIADHKSRGAKRT